MTYVKWTFWGIIALIVVAFFHYTLPQHDIVRVSDTYEKRVDFGENSIFWAKEDTGNATGTINRDVFFIQTIKKNGKPLVYRNEDTGWGWPPYFKFDTSNLQTQASDLRSTSENPKWVMVTHYGWRVEFWSVFPNAIAVKRVDDPDMTIIPWLNIIIILIFLAIVWAIRVRWIRFREKRIDPLTEDMGESWDNMADSARERRGRFSNWIASWRK
ncbi:DUF1523 family protein [Pseudooceanicola sp. MF1-13]|uniref:DUF1523 family protein n=1 Tax=Pseudooceanicola sp. MF1-13 TaxID=3379095 RepID=UPI00389172CC